MKNLYFLFIHNYLSCVNVAWYNISMSKTKRLSSKQKYTMTVIPMTNLHVNLNSFEKTKHLGIFRLINQI